MSFFNNVENVKSFNLQGGSSNSGVPSSASLPVFFEYNTVLPNVPMYGLGDPLFGLGNVDYSQLFANFDTFINSGCLNLTKLLDNLNTSVGSENGNSINNNFNNSSFNFGMFGFNPLQNLKFSFDNVSNNNIFNNNDSSNSFVSNSNLVNSSTGNRIVDYARRFIGKNENDGSADMFWKGLGKYGSWYSKWNSRSSGWCAAYVSYCLSNCGVDMNGINNFKAGANPSSPQGLRTWAKNTGKYIAGANASASSIKPGDVVVWIGDKYYSGHTGIVTEVFPDGTYNAIEGNKSNKVCETKGKGNSGRYSIKQSTGFIKIVA